MPIQAHNPPAPSLEALREAVHTVPKAYAHVAAMIEAILLDLPHHWPHPIYRIGLDEAASAHGLAKPTLLGWRYMARAGSDRDYAIEVQAGENGTKHQFAKLDRGPSIEGIYRVLKDEALQQKMGATVFKLAVLRLNALGVVAVWLQAYEPAHDIFIPLPPAPRCLVPWQQYTINQFQDALRQRAKDKLANEISVT